MTLELNLFVLTNVLSIIVCRALVRDSTVRRAQALLPICRRSMSFLASVLESVCLIFMIERGEVVKYKEGRYHWRQQQDDIQKSFVNIWPRSCANSSCQISPVSSTRLSSSDDEGRSNKT